MHGKRYYWLKLEENYFDLKIQKALRKLPSGAEMLICYLKMQLKYMNKGGLIEYQGIYDDISEEIALDIDEEIDLVKMTLALLTKWKVLEENNNSIFITEIQERVGSKSDSAVRMAKLREKQKLLQLSQCDNNVQISDPIKEKIREDIEKDKEEDIENIYSYIESNFKRTLTPIEYEEISNWEDNELTRYAIKQAVLNGKYNIKYIAKIIHNLKMNSITTVEQAQQNEINYKNNKQNNPEWMNKEIEEETATNEEQEEMERLLSKFK